MTRTVIVGAGIVGLASAFELARRGREVVVVDALTTPDGASTGNAGWIVPAQSGPVPAPGLVWQSMKWMARRESPLYIRPRLDLGLMRFVASMWLHCNARSFDRGQRANLQLASHTMAAIDGYRTAGVEFEEHREGLLQVFGTEQAMARHVAGLEALRDFGLEPMILSATELSNREPALSDRLAGGIYFPHERHVHPAQLLAGLAARCVDLGVTIRRGERVTGFLRPARVTAVETTHGRVEGDEFLLAGGVGTRDLAALLDLRLPIRAGKGYSFDYASAPLSLRSSVKLMEAQVALTPLGDGLRIAGTMEFGSPQHEINAARVRAIRHAPRAYIPSWRDQIETLTPSVPWVGSRPMTPDGLPCIGRLSGHGNCWVAAGHGMLGVTLGPSTGVALADMMTSGESRVDLTPFAPARFRS